MYTWDAAMTVCPAGWRLPARADWDDLVQAAGGAVAGANLKSRSNWNGEDQFGFTALPGGFYNPDNTFYNLGGNAGWWCRTEGAGDKFCRRSLSFEGNNMEEDRYVESAALSVRCIKVEQ
jgi:uncharacterized protein (TIGR02145 family)